MKMISFWIGTLFFSHALWAQTVTQTADCFAAAYPQTVKKSGQQLIVVGTSLPIARSHHKTFAERLNHAGLIDQIAQPYPKTFAAPVMNDDPGRLRNSAFFEAMYGATEPNIRKHLRPTFWQPSGQKVLFNQINGADKALQAVGHELAQHPDLMPYVKKTMGTFHYRSIAGTKRKSAHAYGIAIDIALPKNLYHYWKWSGCKPNQACSYPKVLLKDKKLHRIVMIFEKHGFIWGGKWHHFDSMHFEYRPELLHPQCQLFGKE